MLNTRFGHRYIIAGLISLSILFLTGLFTVLTISLSTPIEMADDYHMGYRELEDKYSDIINKQELFDEKYVVKANNFGLKYGDNQVSISVFDKAGKSVDNAKVSGYMTRPETTKLNMDLPEFTHESDKYMSQPFRLGKEGRWIACIKVQIGDAAKYINLEGWVKK